MKNLKKLLAVLLGAMLTVGVAASASADTVGGTATVVYDAAANSFTVNGEQITYDSNGKQLQTDPYPNLFTGVDKMMPGDTMDQTITIEVTNAGRRTVYLYLRAEDETAEDYRNPTNEDYDKLDGRLAELEELLQEDFRLTAEWDGKVYSDRLVAADGTTTTNNYGVLLGTFNSANTTKDVKVTLSIPVEAGNELHELTANLGWVITADVISPSSGGGDPYVPPTPGTTEEIPDDDTPLGEQPGDEEPGTEIPDDDTPLAEQPGDEEPGTDIPDEDTPLAELPDDEVPLAKLPQTGMLLWPIPLMALAGVLLFIIGWKNERKKRAEK
jgi:hypothetical protein